MNPEKMRHCMSLGYSAKSKLANTIGQCKETLLLPARLYIFLNALHQSRHLLFFCVDGNGFKTSTMRLGADVIVFSRCPGKDGNRFVFY